MEIKALNVAGTLDLIIDVAVVHEFHGKVAHPERHGQLRYPNPDKVLIDTVVAKAQGNEYRPDYLRITTRLFSPWLCRHLAVYMVNLCVPFTSWLTGVPSASLPHSITSLATRNCVSIVARFSFSIARALALPVLRPLPSVWAVTLGLPRALASNRFSPLTPQWTSLSLTTTICFLLPLLSFLAPSSFLFLFWCVCCSAP